jgi:glycosyltransferase involved in cell wall biosynthesis
VVDVEKRVVCLLPARNEERHLPGWLDEIGAIADAVVALDDGSTDETAAILAAHPLVHRVISNPVRDTYAGWDDATNRNRLLEAAAELAPDWILSVDADERLDADDARALREFVAHDALRGLAYGFRVFRMVGDRQHYDPDGFWVYRLFGYAPGQRFPDTRLHLVPIPTSIPRERWIRTTIRIQHLTGLDGHARRARYEKYAEADPHTAYQDRYEHLLAAPPTVETWPPRGQATTGVVLPDTEAGTADGPPADDAPVISVVVIAYNDEALIERAIGAAVAQECPEAFEVIVSSSGNGRTAELVRSRFPGVPVVQRRGRALPGAARNAGLRIARGEYVAFPGSHCELMPGNLAARIRAHDEGHAMVMGAINNGVPTPTGWASYFLDHSERLPGRPAGPLHEAPATCSYLRSALEGIGAFPEDVRTAEDTSANTAMWDEGHRGWFEPDAVLVHYTPCTSLPRLLVHHFGRGRGMGRILRSQYEARAVRSRSFMAEWLVGYVPRRMRWVGENVERWGGDHLRAHYRRVRPLVALAAWAAWAGTWVELLRPRRLGRQRMSVLRRTGRSSSRRGAAPDPGDLR